MSKLAHSDWAMSKLAHSDWASMLEIETREAIANGTEDLARDDLNRELAEARANLRYVEADDFATTNGSLRKAYSWVEVVSRCLDLLNHKHDHVSTT